MPALGQQGRFWRRCTGRWAAAGTCTDSAALPAQTHLRAAIAKLHGLKSEHVCAGSGSDDILDIIMRLVDADNCIISPPTFGMYKFLGALTKIQIVEVPRKADFTVDVPAVVAAVRANKCKLVMLPSPNNPTGTLLPNEDIRVLCKEDALIVVDEAYADFAGCSADELLSEFPNLVVRPPPHRRTGALPGSGRARSSHGGARRGGGGSDGASVQARGTCTRVWPDERGAEGRGVNGCTHLSNDHFWRARARWQVCRTFSKWAGLAGLRVGYALGDPALIERMLAIKQVRPASERESASS